jgi:hypothetical protein
MPSTEQLVAEASDLSITPARAKALSGSNNFYVVEALARNPNLPDDVMAHMVRTMPGALTGNPALLLAALDGFMHNQGTMEAIYQSLQAILTQIASGPPAVPGADQSLASFDNRSFIDDLLILTAEDLRLNIADRLNLLKGPDLYHDEAVRSVSMSFDRADKTIGNFWNVLIDSRRKNSKSAYIQMMKFIVLTPLRLHKSRGLEGLGAAVRWVRKLRPYQPSSLVEVDGLSISLDSFEMLFETLLGEA